MYMCTYVYAYIHACGYADRYGYDCLYMYVYMHMSSRIIKLIDVRIIYLIKTCVHGFGFKTYTPLSTFYVFIIVL